MNPHIRVEAAMALERLQHDLIERSVGYRAWAHHYSGVYYQLIGDSPDMDALRAAAHGFGAIPAAEFKTASDMGYVLVSVDSLESTLGIAPSPRLTELGRDDRIKKIFEIARMEYNRRAA